MAKVGARVGPLTHLPFAETGGNDTRFDALAWGAPLRKRYRRRRAPPLPLRCAPSPLLRLFTLYCTRKRSAAEGEGARRRERGAADDSMRFPAGSGAAERELRGTAGTTAPRDSPAVVRVGLLWRPGAGACPNLLQRRPEPGSAARRSAEYQRFSPRAPDRSGPLQQIWTTRAAAGPYFETSQPPRPHRPGRPGRAPPHAPDLHRREEPDAPLPPVSRVVSAGFGEGCGVSGRRRRAAPARGGRAGR